MMRKRMTNRDTRRHERSSLFLLADLRLAGDDQSFRVKLRNLSAAGLMAEGAMPVIERERVWIDLPGAGWTSARVAWTAGDRCGVAFDTPIDETLVQFPVENIDWPETEAEIVGKEHETR